MKSEPETDTLSSEKHDGPPTAKRLKTGKTKNDLTHLDDTTQKHKSRGGWHAAEDAVIKRMKAPNGAPTSSWNDITAAVNALPESSCNRTLVSVRMRWMKVLQFDTTPELNEVEMGLLEQAVQDVKGKEMWRYVSVRYEELAKARDGVENSKLGRVAAKKFWENKASNKS